MEVIRRAYKTYVTDLRDELDAESAAYRASVPPGLVTKRLLLAFLGACTCLLIVRFCGNVDDPKWLGKLLGPIGLGDIGRQFEHAVTKAADKRINVRIWWATTRIVAYFLLPLLLARFVLKLSLRDTGLSAGSAKTWKIYAGMLALVMPFVVMASFGTAFQTKYPYYKLAPDESLWPNLVLWEVLYASQFIGVEYFFRGYFIHGLRRELGHAALFAPIAPYMMIHYGKPLPEAAGSVVTALILGTMSLKTRSIWGAAFLHAFVAVSMDLLSLWHQGRL